MFRRLITFLVPVSVLFIALISVAVHSSATIGSTALWWGLEFIIIVIYLIATFLFFKSENSKSVIIVHLFLLWNIFSIVRGFFAAEIYWDWKGLIGNAFVLLLPVIIYIAANKDRTQSILSFYVKFVLPISVLLSIPFIPLRLWIAYFYPISLLLLFFPTLKLNWKIPLAAFALVAILDFSVRSNVIKFGVPVLLILLYYVRFFVATDVILKVFQRVFMVAPWIFFVLAVSGIFNVFNLKEYLQVNYIAQTVDNEGNVRKQAITDDSRTFMYQETLHSADKYNYWILGRSPARGNETVAFATSMEEITGRPERLRNEANVPNVFNWTGIIGLILYFLVFLKSSALAIYQSNNIYSKFLGIYVAFRWMYAWVEDPYLFDMNNFSIWLMIGLCFSESFRNMNNFEVQLWARGIFSSKYARIMDYLERETNPRLYAVKN